MKLHQNPLSSNSRKVLILAELLGIAYEPILVDLASREDRARLAKVNPNCKVPVLEDGDFVLWESNAILQYLCDKTQGGDRYYPRDLRPRVEVQRWLSWAGQHWAQAIGGITFERLWKKFVTGQGPDAEQVARHEEELHAYARVLDGHLADRTFVVGDSLTLADIVVATPLDYTVPAQLPVEPYANIRRWLAGLEALPAWKKTAPPPIPRAA